MLSRYRIIGRLGAGGMGVVYEVEDVTLRRSLALKFLTETGFAPISPGLIRLRTFGSRRISMRLQRFRGSSV